MPPYPASPGETRFGHDSGAIRIPAYQAESAGGRPCGEGLGRPIGDHRVHAQAPDEVEIVGGIDGPDVHAVTERVGPFDITGVAAQQFDAGPGDLDPVGQGTGVPDAQGVLSISNTVAWSGANPRTRRHRAFGETHHRHRTVPSDPTEPGQGLDQRALDQAGEAGRVFGLDQQVDGLPGIVHPVEQLVQRQDGRRFAAVPRAEVEALQLGQRVTPRPTCPVDVRSIVRSWTQTSCPSRVSRTSHSSPSAPTSSARS